MYTMHKKNMMLALDTGSYFPVSKRRKLPEGSGAKLLKPFVASLFLRVQFHHIKKNILGSI